MVVVEAAVPAADAVGTCHVIFQSLSPVLPAPLNFELYILVLKKLSNPMKLIVPKKNLHGQKKTIENSRRQGLSLIILSKSFLWFNSIIFLIILLNKT